MAELANGVLGSKTRTHGVEGLEHVHYLKDVPDARDIRMKVIENFERACLPTTTDEERRKLLSFVVCGGGPTGVEFAAELFDMVNEDLVLRVCAILWRLSGAFRAYYRHSTPKSSVTKSRFTSSNPALIS